MTNNVRLSRRLVGLASFVAASLGVLPEVHGQVRQAPQPPIPGAESRLVASETKADLPSRSVEFRAGWGVLPNLRQHSFAAGAHVFLTRRLALGGQFEAYGDTIAPQLSSGRAYHNGGALEVEYVLYRKDLAATTTVELFGAAGAGATALRRRENDNVYERYVTVVAGAGARLVFANRASVHLDLRDSTFVTEELAMFVLVPRLGLGVAF